MEEEQEEIEQRILVELGSGPVSTVWKLCNLLDLSYAEVNEKLQELLERGLVRITSLGWELTPEGRAFLEKSKEQMEEPKEKQKGITHSKKVTKFPFPSDVERPKSPIKPFKEISEKEESEQID